MSMTHDLIVVGAGTGNYLFTPAFDGLRRAIVEPSRFGGTCLNRGCIPTKMFVVAADAVRTAQRADRLGVRARVESVDWPAVRDRIFDRIDPLHERAMAYRRANGVDVYTDAAEFVGPGRLRAGDVELSADRIALAAGSRPIVPDIPGLKDVEHHTSDTIMRLDRLPASMLIVGGGFVAAEMAHVFSSFGVAVTIVHRGPRLLGSEDRQIADRFTELASRDVDVRLDSEVLRVDRSPQGVVGTIENSLGRGQVAAEVVLVAAGRRPNSDLLGLEKAGIEVDEHGHVVTDANGSTTAPGVWSLGDLSNHFQLKHLANAEARTIVHNLTHLYDQRPLPASFVPHAVFADPQVASVGATQQQLQDAGVDHVIAVREYADAAYGWALEDSTSFVKLLADPRQRTLLGAHIIGPDAAILIQPLIQAIMTGQTVDQIAREVMYIHPALTEVVEQALLEL
ncbi:mycothione reductase [Nocardioides albus]|uniref:Mycothione reductase n=1 Tax=Nocardioides albus TaxID=1841 RepID=A0A7W5A7I0_9ACTN|nr:mycothione reductase [Nocardioides albus]MBB3090844.1 mycothione reductase [Nocardioides albus]GGU37861.1 mycothione reductase [Nocardioides albus]